MPLPMTWQRGIREEGFPVELYNDFDPRLMTGFVPVVVSGRTTGFEYFYLRPSDDELIEAGLRGKVDRSVLFCTHSGQTQELIAALIASSVLTKISRGVLVDPQSGECIESDKAIRWAKSRMPRITLDR